MITKVFCKEELIEKQKATFLIVKSFNANERVEKLKNILSDKSWISNISPLLRRSYEERVESTLRLFESRVSGNEDEINSYIGEKIVTTCSCIAIEENLNFKKIPIGDVFKSRADGNGGFDFYNENINDLYIIFGEGKYVDHTNAYNNALKQICDFISDKKDESDLIDLRDLVNERSIMNFPEKRSYSAGFSYFSPFENVNSIIAHIKDNDYFKNLISKYDVIVVGVAFND